MREMKDSGIEWIGEIPAQWKVIPHKYVMHKEKTICAHYDGEEIISLTMNGVVVRDLSAGGKMPTTFDGYQYVEPEDLLLCLFDIDVTPRCVGIVRNYGVTSPAYSRFKVHEGYHNAYYDYLLRFIDDEKVFIHLSKNLRSSLTETDFGAIKTIVPPLEEQIRIAGFLDCKCAEIDAVIERTKATIEEYRKLKQSIITAAVTKGIRGDRPMKDSGVEWIGEMPADWSIKVAFQLFAQVKNKNEGLREQNLLSLSYGKIRRRNIDAVGGLLPESFDGYNIVEKDDIVLRLTDLQNDQTSLRVGISTERGIVTSAYLTLRNQSENTPLFLYYFLHTFDVCKGFYSMGGGVRQGLNWDGLKLLKIVIPSVTEQKEITDFLDSKCTEIDALIAKKTALLEELELYRRSVIYEYVTGKKDVVAVEQSVATIIYPYFPAVLSTKKARFAQAVLMSRILDKCRTKMGRVKLEKMLYTIETSIGFDFDTEYVRQAAGPLDESIYDCEAIISRRNKWYTMKTSKYGVSYTPAKDNGKYKQYYDKYFADYDSEIERIIGIFMDYDADQAEIVATLFAAWNDFVIDRKEFTDEQLADEVLNNWNDSKKRFSKDVWLRAIEQMRRNNIVPKGYGKRTVIKN